MGLEPLPVKPGSSTGAGAGLRRADRCDEAGEDGRPERDGRRRHEAAAARRAPLPTLWNDDQRLRARRYLAQLPGYYLTADAGYSDEDGYLCDHGPHRRRHQRRRPPPVDRRGWRKSLRDRTRMSPSAAVIGVHADRAQGRGAVRPRRPEGRASTAAGTGDPGADLSRLVRDEDRAGSPATATRGRRRSCRRPRSGKLASGRACGAWRRERKSACLTGRSRILP